MKARKDKTQAMATLVETGMIAILSRQDTDGDWIVIDELFITESAIREYLVQHLVFTKNGEGVTQVSLDGEYRFKNYKVADLYEEEITPFIVEHIASESRPGFNHDLYLNEKKNVYHCTCEAFKYHPEKACRHMLELLVASPTKGYTLAEGLHVPVPGR